MCVFLRSMCLKFLVKDYCVDWIIGWVACWIAFMSVFFTLEKLVFKKWLDTSSIRPRHLAICRASQAFSYRNPDSSLIPGGSIERALASSVAPRHLVDRSSFYSWIWWVVPRYLLDTSAVDDHFLNSFLDTCIYRDLLRVYIYLLRDPILIFFDLSWSVRTCSSLKLSLSHSKPRPLWFFKVFQDSSTLGMFLISYTSCISWFET